MEPSTKRVWIVTIANAIVTVLLVIVLYATLAALGVASFVNVLPLLVLLGVGLPLTIVGLTFTRGVAPRNARWASFAVNGLALVLHPLIYYYVWIFFVGIPANPVFAVLLGVAAAAATWLGGFFVARREWSRDYLKYFVALGAGFMLGVAFLEMIPESFHLAGDVSLLFVLAGYLIVHFFEHTVAPHFHFGEETHLEEVAHHHVGYIALGGLAIHAFFDGVAIASGFLISSWLGLVIFFAVVLHKMPEGFTVASLMLASGQSRRVAMLSSAALGAATLIGVLLMNILHAKVGYALPLSAGVTIYVAASDLMPEVNKEPGIRMAVIVFVGVALLAALHYLFHLGH